MKINDIIVNEGIGDVLNYFYAANADDEPEKIRYLVEILIGKNKKYAIQDLKKLQSQGNLTVRSFFRYMEVLGFEVSARSWMLEFLDTQYPENDPENLLNRWVIGRSLGQSVDQPPVIGRDLFDKHLKLKNPSEKAQLLTRFDKNDPKLRSDVIDLVNGEFLDLIMEKISTVIDQIFERAMKNDPEIFSKRVSELLAQERKSKRGEASGVDRLTREVLQKVVSEVSLTRADIQQLTKYIRELQREKADPRLINALELAAQSKRIDRVIIDNIVKDHYDDITS